MPPTIPVLADYPHKTFDKLRYGDTDRQGHVNNAVFSTLLETGRVEMLYTDNQTVHDADCSFVIASLQLDYLGEITWPGRVEIGTRIASVGRSSIAMEQSLFQANQCVATAKTVIVQVSQRSRRSQALSAAAIHRLGVLGQNQVSADLGG